jgi:ABC-2 type transport system ATP-binding protein
MYAMLHPAEARTMRPAGRVLLQAEGLQQSYGARTALRGLTFTLRAGRILGFLGPNGAGKTTSIRILTTMMQPTAGRFTIDGISSDQPEEIRRCIGVLPENLGYPKQLTGSEYLTYFGRLYGRSLQAAQAHGLGLLNELGMETRARSLIGSYSHGMRQRLGIARALINDPVVLFLDEPTLGLDPRGQQELLDLIRRIAQERSVGIILCSHALSEIEDVCDDVVILSGGTVVASGSTAEVLQQTQQNTSVLRVRVPAEATAQAQAVLATVASVASITPAADESGWLRIELAKVLGESQADDLMLNNRILGALIQADIAILNVEAQGGRLQDVFLNVTEEKIR